MVYCRESERKPSCADEIPCPCCPSCGAVGTLRIHGHYYRGVIEYGRGRYVISITRIRCTSCGRTHALLPLWLVGGSAPTVRACARAALVSLREATGAALASARRRARSLAQTVADALGLPVGEAMSALAGEGSCGWAARFARAAMTTPFSRLPLAQVTGGD